MEKQPCLEIMGIEEYFSIYKGKKVLITGHTGFKGSWLSIWLHHLGAQVIGLALDPITNQDNYLLSGIGNQIKDYRIDIRNYEKVKELIDQEKPEILFHLAAQPIVLDSYNDPIYTYETNIMGTVHLLEAFRMSDSLKTAVFITTDKCYNNKEWVHGYRETDALGGHDPYSSSKGAAELAISSYRNSYFQNSGKKIASVRAGNVIGGGDWSPYRLVVDIVKSIEADEAVEIRNPKATRPWQHVLEPLGGYLLLGSRMIQAKGFDEAWNFGPEPRNVVSVEVLLENIIKIFGKGSWIDKSDRKKLHEASLLSLDISKAKHYLNWSPVLSLEETVEFTVDWYKNYQHTNVKDLCLNQIEQYTRLWRSRNEN